MKLISLKIFSRGKAGLSSNLLKFGEEITQLYGPNGSGKTPLVQSIAFCLGYNSIFREAIYHSCEHARLEFSVENRTFISSRTYSREFDLTLEENNRVQRFYSEREFSDYLFDILGLDGDRRLVGINNAVVLPYISTLLPLYYLDQDNGYSNFYSPPNSFIKDQHSEMMRIAFHLPAKHSFDQKKDSIELKKKLTALDQLVAEREKQYKDAIAQYEIEGEPIEVLQSEMESLQLQLNGFKNSNLSQSESADAMQQVAKTNLRKIATIDANLQDIELRLQGKLKIIDEINSEINTLSLNEDARRIFISFTEICASTQCGIFMKSSESYGKNLLYLRDQIKDLDRNSAIEEERKSRLIAQRQELVSANKEIEHNQVIAKLNTESEALVEAISTIKNRIFAVQLKIADKKKVEVLEKRYREKFFEREALLSRLQELGTERGFSPDLTLVRSDFRKRLIKWLDALNTPNVSFDISFKNDFTPVFGTEDVTQLKGSTRLRTVLAYHAAFIELMAEKKGGLNLFILDTPKQHDIHNDDLNSFFIEIKRISKALGVQIIFSSTEYHYVGDAKDTEWNPTFPGKQHPMYLGTDAR